MMTGLVDQSPEVRQAASYGIGVCGQFGGPAYATACGSKYPSFFFISDVCHDLNMMIILLSIFLFFI